MGTVAPVFNITNMPPGVQVDAPITVMTPEQSAPVVNVTMPEQEPPVVNVAVPAQDAPIVNVTVEPQETPVVYVEAPNVNVEAPEVTVNVPEQRAVTKRVVREGGQITSIIEEPADG
jgi:phage baseplate assembly protein gpV